METPTVGSIIAVKFPFSDLSADKIRPALVLAIAEFGDLIVCQITSSPYTSTVWIKITQDDAKGMITDSYIRPDKLFTADQSLVVRTITSISAQKMTDIKGVLREVLGM